MKTSTDQILHLPKPLAVGRDSNKLKQEDRAAHDWYRFVLSFPPHLVRDCVSRFDLDSNAVVLDPFCGTGTTIVEDVGTGLAITHCRNARPDPVTEEYSDRFVIEKWSRLGR